MRLGNNLLKKNQNLKRIKNKIYVFTKTLGEGNLRLGNN
jgi:hypothetical protein